MKTTRPLIGILIVICVLIVSAAGFLIVRQQATTQLGSRPSPIPPAGPMIGGPTLPFETASRGMKKGVIYVVSAKGGDDNNLIAEPVTWRSSQSPALDALNTLAKADDSPLPSGTQLRGVKVADGLATVDFSREFQTHFHGGETGEAQTVNSVLLTLGQFPSIDRVQILVEGKPIDALSQLLISAPLDVIRPQAVRQVRNSGN